MAKKNRARTVDSITDCACVIHGTGYDWQYVEKLYNMLSRNLPNGLRFHVYTEATRPVPDNMIKHALTEWPGIAGPKREWWYKMQLFNPEHYSGNLLYMDLDVVIIDDVSWIPCLHTDYFWTIKDFRYLQKSAFTGMNSSIMWWNTKNFEHIWQDFCKIPIDNVVRQYQGDQDYLGVVIDHNQRRYFETPRVQSWRWEVADGGYNFQQRKAINPGSGAKLNSQASVLVFHGRPKPHEINDPVIQNFWR